jgi:hypothetical protein
MTAGAYQRKRTKWSEHNFQQPNYQSETIRLAAESILIILEIDPTEKRGVHT